MYVPYVRACLRTYQPTDGRTTDVRARACIQRTNDNEPTNKTKFIFVRDMSGPSTHHADRHARAAVSLILPARRPSVVSDRPTSVRTVRGRRRTDAGAGGPTDGARAGSIVGRSTYVSIRSTNERTQVRYILTETPVPPVRSVGR